jgi:Transposase DDE domain
MNIGKALVFLTNKFTLPAIAICALYKARWQVELFFKWIKQFFGPSGNSVKSHIGIAVSVYVLVAMVKKRLNLDAPCSTLLQIFQSPCSSQCPCSMRVLAASTKPNRATTATNRIDSCFNRTLLIRNSFRPQIVFLIPAHWVELQPVDYFWQCFAQRVARLPAEKRAGARDVERIMVVRQIDHPRLEEWVGVGQQVLEPAAKLGQCLGNAIRLPVLAVKLAADGAL